MNNAILTKKDFSVSNCQPSTVNCQLSTVVRQSLLFTLVPVLSIATSISSSGAHAQSAADIAKFSLPNTVPKDTTVRIDGSSSMASINLALKKYFESQYPGTQVKLHYGGTKAALTALIENKIEIAAIGRPLTVEEKAKGLLAIPLPRRKIAIVVGANNPFKNSLTTKQVAKIFQGEITDWSEIGGTKKAIRLVDRPQSSDTRQILLQEYPLLIKSAQFGKGKNVVQLREDSTTTLIKQLGDDGIGFAIAEQVKNQSGVRTLLIHQTSAEDSKYPFSQPFYYVYKQAPSPTAKFLLGVVAAPIGKQVIKEASQVNKDAIATGSLTPNQTDLDRKISPITIISTPTISVKKPGLQDANATSNEQEQSWILWLLPVALVGGIGLWMKRRSSLPLTNNLNKLNINSNVNVLDSKITAGATDFKSEYFSPETKINSNNSDIFPKQTTNQQAITEANMPTIFVSETTFQSTDDSLEIFPEELTTNQIALTPETNSDSADENLENFNEESTIGTLITENSSDSINDNSEIYNQESTLNQSDLTLENNADSIDDNPEIYTEELTITETLTPETIIQSVDESPEIYTEELTITETLTPETIIQSIDDNTEILTPETIIQSVDESPEISTEELTITETLTPETTIQSTDENSEISAEESTLTETLPSETTIQSIDENSEISTEELITDTPLTILVPDRESELQLIAELQDTEEEQNEDHKILIEIVQLPTSMPEANDRIIDEQEDSNRNNDGTPPLESISLASEIGFSFQAEDEDLMITNSDLVETIDRDRTSFIDSETDQIEQEYRQILTEKVEIMPENQPKILWQIGQPHTDNVQSRIGIFPKRGGWTQEYDYDVDTDLNPQTRPNLPSILVSKKGLIATKVAATDKLNIQFRLERNYDRGQLLLFYDRYGTESDRLELDGELLTLIPGGIEGQLQQHQIPIGAITQGKHTLSITTNGGDGTHAIDFLKLQASIQVTDEQTIWQIGQPQSDFVQSKVGIYPKRGGWTPEFNYYVDSDDDSKNAPNLPSILVSKAVTVAKVASTDKLNIHFHLARDYNEGELLLFYDRYGAEDDNLFLDGQLLAFLRGGLEGQLQQHQIPLKALTAGRHTLSITTKGGNGKHSIDFLKLETSVHVSDENLESSSPSVIWQIGQPHTDFVQSRVGIFPKPGGWTPEYDYDLDSDPNPQQQPNLPSILVSTEVITASKFACTDRLNIHFRLKRNYDEGELLLFYDRYGAEEDNLSLDEQLLTLLPGGQEGELQKHQIPIKALASGKHILSITTSGGDGKHSIGFLKLRSSAQIIQHQAIWQIGQPQKDFVQSRVGIFPKPGSWTPEYNYNVNSDPNSIDRPNLPSILTNISANTKTQIACTEQLNIHFRLQRNYDENELLLFYDRYGAEDDNLFLNGQLLALLPGGQEGELQKHQIPLKELASGKHTLSITTSGGNGKHAIDFLKLQTSV